MMMTAEEAKVRVNVLRKEKQTDELKKIEKEIEKVTTPIAETKEGQQKIRAEVRKVLKEFRYGRNIKQ